MSAPAVVPASYMKLSTLVDGTIRVVIDVESRHMAAVTAICAKPGAPVALAALTNEAAVRADHETAGGVLPGDTLRSSAQGEDALALRRSEAGRPAASSPAPKRERTLAEKAWSRIGENSFQEWIFSAHKSVWLEVRRGCETAKELPTSPYLTDAAVKSICGIGSKAELNYDAVAAERWLTLEADYLAHARGVAA